MSYGNNNYYCLLNNTVISIIMLLIMVTILIVVQNAFLPCQVSKEFWMFCCRSQFFTLGTKSWTISTTASPTIKMFGTVDVMYNLVTSMHHRISPVTAFACRVPHSTFCLNSRSNFLHGFKLVRLGTTEFCLCDSLNSHHVLSPAQKRTGMNYIQLVK